MLDAFLEDNAFTHMSLTDAVNKIPHVPGQCGALFPWAEQGVHDTKIAVEVKQGEIALVKPSPRGSPGQAFDKSKRKIHDLEIPHYQINDGIYADEVRSLRAFGEEQGRVRFQQMVNERSTEHVQWRMDPTIEFQRLGAIKGTIVDGYGNTVLNLFTALDITPPSEIPLELESSDGTVRKQCAKVHREMAKVLGGVPFTGIVALCSESFYDELIKSPEVRDTYKNYAAADNLRGGYAYGSFPFGGITFVEYRGAIGGVDFVASNKCHFAPLGVPGLYRTVFAPADYVDTIDDVGKPRYQRVRPFPDDKGVELEYQANALSYIVRPEVLIPGRTT